MKIGIQGVQGAFHEEAARKFYQYPFEVSPILSFDALVKSVENDDVDQAIMAVENTISGTMHENLKLIRMSDLTIIGEVYLRIQQNLVALKGSNIEDLKEVHSHYMAINQCRHFFKQHKEIELVNSADTALSMQEIAKDNIANRAALGSLSAAALYDLEVLAEGIETNKENYTRFLVLGKSPIKVNLANKASFSVVLKSGNADLVVLLSIIHSHQINLTKIESTPLEAKPWAYRFYIDVVYKENIDFEAMLKQIQRITKETIVLGKYPKGEQYES